MEVTPNAQCAISMISPSGTRPAWPRPAGPFKANPELVYEHTNKGNTVAVVSDGTRVLGLGDIGAKAAIPVMEGKALLYKYLGGVDAVPVCLDTKDPDEFIRTVLMLQPSFGGVNLEDISQPKCFYILDTLREQAEIPIWHDDQQGTATVALAGLINALKIVGKRMDEVKVVFLGSGASNVACMRLMFAAGPEAGELHGGGQQRHPAPGAGGYPAAQGRVCGQVAAVQYHQRRGRTGGIAEALVDADVCIALSTPGPGTLQVEWVKQMAEDAIVFAWPTLSPRCGPGKPRRRACASLPPAAPISPTRSTTRWASPASSAARWTCAPAPSPTRCASPLPQPWPIPRWRVDGRRAHPADDG